MSELSSYFGSYAKAAPSWLAFVEERRKAGGKAIPGFCKDDLASWQNEDGSPQLIEVTPDNYPKIYGALQEECEFRGIPMPACYVDTTGTCSWGWARRAVHAVAIEDGLHEICTQRELRWIVAHEVKHLYQTDFENETESLLEEYDCDRAAVESTDYETAQSFFHKGGALKINQKINFPPLRSLFLAIHENFPHLLSEHFPIAIDANNTDLHRFKIAIDKLHPSPAKRMKAMREHAASLENHHDHS